MIGPPRAVRIWAYPEPADLRRGYNGLYGLVKQGLGRDPLSGEVVLFLNKKRSSCKLLYWDGTGLCIFMKRLERGRFANIWRVRLGARIDVQRAIALRRRLCAGGQTSLITPGLQIRGCLSRSHMIFSGHEPPHRVRPRAIAHRR